MLSRELVACLALDLWMGMGWVYEVGLARVVHEVLRLRARSVCKGWIRWVWRDLSYMIM